ncbi:MAG: nicotinate phosphoribosyltransferase [Deltaproteobacteria bacterium]|nr:nicotinate phosphoribosyltransferase [Deltaproteobacteria bacterium]
MAEAGWPLRQERFYYTHRRGGPHYLPFSPAEEIAKLLPRDACADAGREFLRQSRYAMGGAFWEAMKGAVQVDGLPRGAWFFDREPVFSVSGPSAMVSWLEPLTLQLHYRVQVATQALLHPERLDKVVGHVTCDAQRDLVLETLDALRVQAPPILVEPEAYYDEVRARVAALVGAVEDPKRLFEVGMRAATCLDQHRIALQACKDAGVMATSNVALARELGMRPVGTMGHEHLQRYGNDRDAFRAMRDRYPGPSSFLLDTFDTVRSGIPAAFDLIAEGPDRRDAVRFDSGDKRSQYLIATSLAQGRGIRPRFVLEDGFDLPQTLAFEDLRRLMGVRPEDQAYGYGGHIVQFSKDPLSRDRVAAVYKLTQSGPWATMKFGDEPGAGKESIPGAPVLYRPYLGSASHHGPTGIVAQEGEEAPEDAVRLTGAEQLPLAARFSAAEVRDFPRHKRPAYSPATLELVKQQYAARDRAIREV